MRYILTFLFVVLSSWGQQTNLVSTNIPPIFNYSRLNLRDKNSWQTIISSNRVSMALAWKAWWNRSFGARFNTVQSTNTPPQQNQPVNNQPAVQPTPQPLTPVPPANQPLQQNPQIGMKESRIQSAIGIENLNNTIWKNSGWQIVNPYESLLREYRMGARTQRDYSMNPISAMGMNSGMGMGGMGGSYNSQLNFNQQGGGIYGNSNYGMGNYNNIPNGGNMYQSSPAWGMNGWSDNYGGMGGYNMGFLSNARGRMNGANQGHGGMNTQIIPYF
jgi:hypothetical protein